MNALNKLSIRGVSRTFTSARGQATQALLPVDFEVRENDFVTILGPSGCGKSTLLRIVAGLDFPTAGQVVLDGQPVEGPGADRGMVFQSYTLFPWLTIEQNIRFGLRERGMGAAEQKDRSDYFISKVGLRGFEQQREQASPADLSALKAGRRVVVCAGPLKGLEGLVSATAGKRITVLLDVLGRQTRVSLPDHQLEALAA